MAGHMPHVPFSTGALKPVPIFDANGNLLAYVEPASPEIYSPDYKAENEKAHAVFVAIDTDRSKAISATELRIALQRLVVFEACCSPRRRFLAPLCHPDIIKYLLVQRLPAGQFLGVVVQPPGARI